MSTRHGAFSWTIEFTAPMNAVMDRPETAAHLPRIPFPGSLTILQISQPEHSNSSDERETT
jgi:hypothetical protein